MGGIYPILVLFSPFAYEFRPGLFYESRGSSLYCGADCYQTAHTPVIILNSASFDCQSDSSSEGFEKQWEARKSTAATEEMRPSKERNYGEKVFFDWTSLA